MEPRIKKALKKRYEWIRRNPEAGRDYVYLSRKDQARVDRLFLGDRKLRPGEVDTLVARLTETRLARRRVGDLRKRALANLLSRLADRPKLRDSTVVGNVSRMSGADLKYAAQASTDDIIDRARNQEESENPFWYH